MNQSTRHPRPSISCVCITKGRPALLQKAIGHFDAQTYENKNLVIVYEGDEDLSPKNHSSERIKIIRLRAGSELSLGERRNLSIQNCTGDYFCQWDDDDWYHNRRLELQMEALARSGKSACVLTRVILYDGVGRRAYLSSQRNWEGTLLCSTNLFKDSFRYPQVNRSEDNSLVVNLLKNDYVHALSAPHLYAYYFHGKNTWDQAHFNQLFQSGYILDNLTTKTIEKVFLGEYNSEDASQKVQGLNLDVLW